MPIYIQLIFFCVMGVISGGLSYYTLHRLHDLFERFNLVFPAEAFTFMASPIGVSLSVLVIFNYFLVGKSIFAKKLRPLGWLSALWMGYLALTLFYAGPLHLIEISLIFLTKNTELVQSLLGWTSLISVHVALVYGVWNGSRKPMIKAIEICDDRIHKDLDQYRILQLSDIHIGPSLGWRFINQLDDLCAQIRPDLIVMTGDLVDGDVSALADEVKQFLSLGRYAHHGLLIITGNHEYISGAQAWVEFIKAEGGRILENEHINLQVGDQMLSLIGVEDWDAHKFDPQRKASLSKAMTNLPTESFKILLAHQPKIAKEASEAGIHLQLSGHTHAGQIFPFNYLIYLDQPYNVGRYQVGQMSLYVSPGTGYWGPPLRVGTRAEATLLTLKHSQ